MSKAVAGSSTVAAEAQGAASLSRGLWGDKQKKEKMFQKQRDHVNRSLLAFATAHFHHLVGAAALSEIEENTWKFPKML